MGNKPGPDRRSQEDLNPEVVNAALQGHPYAEEIREVLEAPEAGDTFAQLPEEIEVVDDDAPGSDKQYHG